ncbi:MULTISPECIES: flagellar basal-body rod protein FlgG [Chromobacterium]|uniref:Flagellar basal-body rod protein FlgG n=3 Tax=Chromobacterium TaxID=535 RepID=A0A1W0D5V4_9NEIS|nr:MULTISPECIES: flagellar basal-body rod protein FlgG [Chromobacterium]AXT47027.1 flagellar basal-body rod protein FlgG [Chromobacterium rhizoryzae]MBK0415662.1 flagellar basal-body rod protein FlgG [Chromobacterium haemolyticum]MBO0417076.1 flagellar basal-body rod protein FlgG [Chromobacterium haemolyticum]MBO0500213.1 flagellar basal-body rod protein FlgG [Chromobacterium haemolyticum]MCS3803651.1 flagellar basal-body rod protein FlgG [Chromobacterium alkanivorans]
MMRALYIAKTGMDSSQFQLDVVSNNLANVNTVGFKRSRGIFEDLYYQTLRQPGAQLANGNTTPTGLQVGTGSAAVATARIHSQGNMTQTGQPLDMAIAGEGFFRIQLPDGTTAYTRNGEFKRNSNGDVVNPDGYPLNPNINIPGTANQITVSTAGVVQYFLPNNPAAQTAGTIQLTTFINPQGLESVGNNLYLQSASSGDPQDGDPQTDTRGAVRSGFVEASNVNVTEELVNMITAQRAFEMNSRAITTADQMLQKLSQL